MAVIFKTFDQIEIDGQSAGNIVDVVSNHGPRRAEVLAAFGVYTAGLRIALDQEKTALASAHKTALDTANATIATRDATIATLETRVASLLAELPFNPRIIDASKFYERITKDEFAALSVSDDETLRTIAKTILAYKTNDWPVIFESPEFQGLIAYLVGAGFFTAERAAELTADATRAEAYDAE